MSGSQRLFCVFNLKLSSSSPPSSSPSHPSRTFLFSHSTPFHSRSLRFLTSLCRPTMTHNQIRVGHREQRWKEQPGSSRMSPRSDSVSAGAAEPITSRLGATSIAENSGHTHAATPSIQFGSVGSQNRGPVEGQHAVWKPWSYGTVRGATAIEVEKAPADQTAEKTSADLSKLFKSNILENFTVDNSTYSLAQIRATFYPKFENEKSDQEVRTRMIEMVSKGLATMEVSLKHSGSLFMYAGHEGGAYAKNSYGNIYTAVGVFVLGRMFREAWGTEARKKQAQFNDFLERNHMCVSMELVTAVLGDHGQRPRDDYVVVTAVTELGNGKPMFYSTPDIIVFCREWRLLTNHIWLFSTRKSVTSFFAAYDALCEEGTAVPVCKALDEVADISVPGSKDHIKVQGEILEGLVARIVSHESSKHMEQVLRDFPLQPFEGANLDLGPSLREICAANRSNENQQIKALLESVGTSFCPNYVDWLGNGATDSHSRTADRSVLSKFLQAHPADFSTTKLQEMVQLMRERHFSAAFKCYHNFHKVGSASTDDLYFKMVIHVHNDSVFRRYQKEMRNKPGLWPLYRGFFVDINLFKANKEKVAEMDKNSNDLVENVNNSDGTSRKDGLADEDANLMIKLKFLTYKLRTFLIRNGLSILFKQGPAAYKTYYLRQMKIWNTSQEKQNQLSKMLDEWAVYIRRKYGKKALSSSTYLSEAEPFLEQYAKRSQQNQALIGSAGNLVSAEDFMAIVEGGRDEEGDLHTEKEEAPPSPSTSTKDTVAKDEALIVFFPGIPGCAKSALCKEIVNAPEGLGDDRRVNSLMGDLIKGKYWDKVNEQCRRKDYSVILADKNAPNEEVWSRIEEMCRNTRASAVPVVPDSEGTETNPFSLDALSVFMFRVLQRVNHPGNLDKNSPNAGYVLLMFYNLYDGKSRKEFEGELIERFGSLVKMPLLKPDRSPLPDSLKSILEEGINLFKLHQTRHGRLESTKGSYANDWAKWEKQLRETLCASADYLNSIQVPFEVAVEQVVEQLRSVVKGDYKMPSTQKRKSGNIIFAAVSLPVNEIRSLLDNLAEKHPQIKDFLGDKNMETNLKKAHVTLAHKAVHSVSAVANYGVFIDREVPVEMTALLFSDKMAALETCLGSVDGEKIISKNEWPHSTLWTGKGAAAKDANLFPQLHSEGKAIRIDIDPPHTITGIVQFY
ncbi:tRNA ligase 1-like [Rhododendron vialii]|uniref:tRNA ligase 1-like n=1 Tax=Rhododendron vialii TaxID=182163 RepID=UPI00265E4EBA|nr:tRNA ligase 1-like [Rhododendron vialii]